MVWFLFHIAETKSHWGQDFKPRRHVTLDARHISWGRVYHGLSVPISGPTQTYSSRFQPNRDDQVPFSSNAVSYPVHRINLKKKCSSSFCYVSWCLKPGGKAPNPQCFTNLIDIGTSAAKHPKMLTWFTCGRGDPSQLQNGLKRTSTTSPQANKDHFTQKTQKLPLKQAACSAHVLKRSKLSSLSFGLCVGKNSQSSSTQFCQVQAQKYHHEPSTTLCRFEGKQIWMAPLGLA